jgi:hypothetical protein
MSKNGTVIFARIGIHKPEDWPSGLFRFAPKFIPTILLFLILDIFTRKNFEQEQLLIKPLENIPKPAQWPVGPFESQIEVVLQQLLSITLLVKIHHLSRNS